jgi:hypothetical protein
MIQMSAEQEVMNTSASRDESQDLAKKKKDSNRGWRSEGLKSIRFRFAAKTRGWRGGWQTASYVIPYDESGVNFPVQLLIQTFPNEMTSPMFSERICPSKRLCGGISHLIDM